MHVIKEPKQHSFDKVGVKGKVFPLENLTEDIEYFLIETKTGHTTKILQKKSTFIYYVLEGQGYFEINGKKENCSKGDLVVIPPKSSFIYKGNLKMIATSTPPWKEDQEITLED